MSCNSKIILSTRQKNTQSFIFRYTIFIKILYFYKPYIALDLGTYYKMVFVNKNCNSKTRANAIILFLALLILSVWECKGNGDTKNKIRKHSSRDYSQLQPGSGYIYCGRGQSFLAYL